MKRGHKRSGFAFTLTELLVVIAVIAILASLLLPSLSRSKLAGDTAVCRNNLRQQSMGLAMYVNDFGAYPQYATTFIGPATFWMQLLEGYVGDKWPESNRDGARTTGKGVFACPGYNRVRGVYYHPADKGLYGGSGAYAYNAVDGMIIVPAIYGFGGKPINPPSYPYELQPIKETEVAIPSRMISLGDSTIESPAPDGPEEIGWPAAPAFWHLAEAIYSENLAEVDRSLTPGDKAMLRRHGGRWNEVFCDGHVETGSLEDFFDYRKDEVLKLWNRDNQTHQPW